VKKARFVRFTGISSFLAFEIPFLSDPAVINLFHQHFMRSFYTCRYQRRKNDSQVNSHFLLLGSTRIKVAHKHVGEIDPWCQFHQHFYERIFRTNIVSAAFTTYMQLEKDAEMMFVRKMRVLRW